MRQNETLGDTENVQSQDKFILRLPTGMRDRIKEAADRSGRSMNAEIVWALEEFFPETDKEQEAIEKLHAALLRAKYSGLLSYDQILVEGLTELLELKTSGIGFSSAGAALPREFELAQKDTEEALARRSAVERNGVAQVDLERALEKGLLRKIGRYATEEAFNEFRGGNAAEALRILRLSYLKFEDPKLAISSIEQAVTIQMADMIEHPEKWGIEW